MFAIANCNRDGKVSIVQIPGLSTLNYKVEVERRGGFFPYVFSPKQVIFPILNKYISWKCQEITF